jgi:heat shock protein HtpX
MLNIYEQVDANKKRSFFIMAAFAAFVVLVTYVLGNVLGFGPGGVGLALILAGLVSFGSYYWGDKIVLTVSGARSANRETDFDFYTVAENLALGAGLPKPRLYVIEEQALNAFATGRDPEHAVICTTRGLLNNLERSELEGVLAHELSHIRNYDTRLMSIVAILVGMIILLSDWFTRSLWWGRRSGDREERENLGAIFFLLAVIFSFL